MDKANQNKKIKKAKSKECKAKECKPEDAVTQEPVTQESGKHIYFLSLIFSSFCYLKFSTSNISSCKNWKCNMSSHLSLSCWSMFSEFFDIWCYCVDGWLAIYVRRIVGNEAKCTQLNQEPRKCR